MGVAAEIAPHIDAGAARPARGPDCIVVMLFALTGLIGSGLLFVVEPMVAKMLSPAYGGSPTVWSTSVFFFQIATLVGYLYVHWAQRLLNARGQLPVQILLAVAPLFVLPFTLPTWSGTVGSTPPVLRLLLILTMVVGAPIAVLSMMGALVQRWYSSSGLPRSNDPYFLCAAGNIGGMLALLGYPFVIEPAADLATQARWWVIAYGVFTALVIACGLIVRFRTAGVPAEAPVGTETVSAEQISWARRARWLGLAFIPSSLMLGTTTRISTHIAAIPLIWVMPLALYVATFTVTFGLKNQRWMTPTVTAAAISAAVIPWTLYLQRALAADIVLCLALVLVAGLACHGLLAQDRPTPRRLTEFLMIVSLGCALGGAFNSLLAPMVFNWGAELPLVVTALAVLPLALHRRPDAPTAWRFPGAEGLVKAFVFTGPLLAVAAYLNLGRSWLIVASVAVCLPWCVLAVSRPRAMAVGVALTTAVLFWYQTPNDSFRKRTFFGAYEVYLQHGWWVLSDGTTMRGYQYATVPIRTMPVSYYGRPGPLGDLFAGYGDRSRRIAIVGLGTGVEASYGHRGQWMDFYEPDRTSLDIARNRFGYLNDSKAKISAILGDGRIQLDKVPDGRYGMIILDAFNSGAVPTHLLTREALQLYARKLSPGGVLAFHVTKRNLDLAPMLRATARSVGLASMTGYGYADPKRIYQNSTWVAIARSDSDLQPLRAKAWRWKTPPTGGPVWTDAQASPIGVLKFG
jgi:SAM-dependent methyltransferase